MAAAAKQDALILELFKADPDNDRLTDLDAEHWRRIPPVGPNASKLNREIEDVLARSHNEKLKAEVHFARAQTGLFKAQQRGEAGSCRRRGIPQEAAEGPARRPIALHGHESSRTMRKSRSRSRTGSSRNTPTPGSPSPIRGDPPPARGRRQAVRAGIHRCHLGLDDLDEEPEGEGRRRRLLGDLVRPVRRRDAPHEGALCRVPRQGRRVHRGQPRSAEGAGRAGQPQEVRQGRTGSPGPSTTRARAGTANSRRSWGINSIPAMFIVDTEGKLYSRRGPRQARGDDPQAARRRRASRARPPAAGG